MKNNITQCYKAVLQKLLNKNKSLLSVPSGQLAQILLTNSPLPITQQDSPFILPTKEQIRKRIPDMFLQLGLAIKREKALSKKVQSVSVLKEEVKPELIPDDYTVDIQKRIQSSREKILQSKYDRLLTDYEQISSAYDDLLVIKDHKTSTKFFDNDDEQYDNEATAILQWSDWHIEEVVNPSTVLGLNKFNPEIAKARVNKLINNTVKVLRSQAGAVNIKYGVIWLGGDFITGYLREHDMQENAMTPVEAIMYAEELLKGAIEFMIEHSGFEKIKFICNRGNHPRLTPKMQPSNDYKMNLETLLYHMLKQHFASNENILFEIPDGPIGMTEVYGKKIRHFHGHEIQYKDGVGGLSIPLVKKIQKWDTTMQADFNLMGHYHQCYKPLKTCMLNGSLVGYNAYAMSGGFAYEPAMQSFQLLDKKRGFTMHTTIDCD